MLLSVSRRIWYSTEQKFPDRYVDTVISVLQTTSVPSFNQQFQHIASQRTREETEASVIALTGTTTTPKLSFENNLSSVEKLISMANPFFDDYTRKEVWSTHVKGTKPQAGALVASNPPKCFNCGGSHHMEKCTKPIDQARVERAKAQFLQDKRARRQSRTSTDSSASPNSSATSTGTPVSSNSSTSRGNGNGPRNGSRQPDNRFRPPDNENETRRFIHIRAKGLQPYVWDATTNRWNLQQTPGSATGSANTVAPPTPKPTKPTANTAGTSNSQSASASDPALRAEVARMQQQLQHLLNQI